MTKVYFRADGNSKIGLGHVYRSLALAEMLQSDFDCFFMIRAPIKSLKENIEKQITLIELPEISLQTNESEEAAALAENYFTNKDIIILDGYHFDKEYQNKIKSKGAKLVSIDDIYESFFVSDLVINHAGGITKSKYKTSFYTQFCLGLDYLLLRKEFLLSAQKPYKKDNNNLFICMGGADINNDIIAVLAELDQKIISSSINCILIIGQAYKYRSELENFIKKTKLRVEILTNLSAKEMLDVMQNCSAGICPPSSLSLEYLCSGGALYLLQTADNQRDVKKFLIQKKLAVDFKTSYPIKSSELSLMIDYQENMVDGKSKIRLLKAFKLLEKEIALSYEEATEKHMMQYLHWANDPVVRKNAFNTSLIQLNQHITWFNNIIQSDRALLLYFYNKNQPVGQVRFEINSENYAQIDYSVDASQKGKGYGTIILKKAILYAINKRFCSNFYGEVKIDNIASRTIFKKLSFKEKDEDTGNFLSYKLELSLDA